MNKDRVYIGIDPGVNGGIAFLIGSDVLTSPMPESKREIIDCLSKFSNRPQFAVLEKVSSSPQMGVVSAFTFGGSFHGLEMALAALRIPYDLVRPKTWQKALSLSYPPKSKGSEKKLLGLKRAQALFPDYFSTFGERSKGKQLAVADALMLAEFARRTHGHD